jgi:hypothetical protein
MRDEKLLSVQLDNGTDGFGKRYRGRSSQTPNDALQAPHRYRPPGVTGLADRALHPLWKTRMQLRQYSWPWPKILPLGELSGPSPRTGLRFAALPRSGQTIPCQLPYGKAAPGGDFHYQPRIAEAQREVVETQNGRPTGAFHVDRHRGVRAHRGEYALHTAHRLVAPWRDRRAER